MSKIRLDTALVKKGLVTTRSQAESYIKLGSVKVDGKIITKPGYLVASEGRLELTAKELYVSRAGLKLASVANKFKLDFNNKLVLDVGSSTGGFTDFALQHGAKKVIAIDVGTKQLHSSLQGNKRIELHEQTDIRDAVISQNPDIILIDVSFISLREVLPTVAKIAGRKTLIVAMAKPQFETGGSAKHEGVIKNDKMRRNTLQELENWIKNMFVILDKADSEVAGAKGNVERFYLLKFISQKQ